ncbi:MAG: nucleoside deaminase [Longimicrobiales bacterium]|nr:nucleoside deaminase [Longimicrobiales bacterium]
MPLSEAARERAERWRRYLDDFVPSPKHRHETYALEACRLALDAVEAGTYGVGAVLLDPDGRVLVAGHNRVHAESFRSDLHAEMVVMNEYEAFGWPRKQARDHTLITSLESCPMCMTRLIVAGVGKILHVAEDPVGGMVQRKQHLPPIFRTIAAHQEQVWAPAECSVELRVAAFKIWIESRDNLNLQRR